MSLKKEIKHLRNLNPERMKKNLALQKKKVVAQGVKIKELAASLKQAKKELSDIESEANQQTDPVYISKDKRWEVFLSRFTFAGEPGDSLIRLRALDRKTGASFVACDVDVWSDSIKIPDDVSIASGARITKHRLNTRPVAPNGEQEGTND